MNITSNGLKFEVESTGPEDAPAVLLTMGLGMQLVAWPDALIQALVKAGFRVVRYDNRDVGLSSHLDHLGQPQMLWQFLKSRVGLALKAPYSLQDMAVDAIGILDALNIRRAHLFGVSMGGMISQRVAATAPERTLSLTSIMSSSGAPGLPGPGSEVTRAMMQRPRSGVPQDVVDHTLEVFKLIASPAFPQDFPAYRQHLMEGVQRSYNPPGVMRQMLAVVSDTTRHELLARITCPTLVIHGTADPLVPIEGGRDTARRIAGARFEAIEGMGHDWPPGVARRLADLSIPHLLSVLS
jgi:pimeloyl-ACP methyl ester carboxylesterase